MKLCLEILDVDTEASLFELDGSVLRLVGWFSANIIKKIFPPWAETEMKISTLCAM